MNLSLRPAARVSRRSMGHIVWVVVGVALGCSQRNEWRDHYIDPPAAPRPKPTPRPTQPDPVAADAAADSAVDSAEVTATPSSAPNESSGAWSVAVDAGNGSAPLAIDAALPALDAGADAQAPLADGAPLINAGLDDLELNVFGTFDNRYWFVVSSEQVELMNQGRYGGPIGMYGDIYNPIGGNDGKTYADHLLVSTADGLTADVGKVQATLVGGSTYRPWTESTLPNIKIDSNEYQDSVRLGGYEHLRFNNGVIGSIFREKFAFDYYRALGYPAPNAGYAWVSSTVWAPDVAVPYIVVESYKRQFCRDRDEYFGGECPNMWEFASDITWAENFNQPDSCQYSDCDATLATQMSNLVAQTAQGPGFKDATATYIDWDAFHEFQCLSWLFGTGDDYVHGGNNTVLVERPDGKFQFLPYSVDISFNHDWAWSTPLPGQTSLPQGCQSDPDCWQDTIATCAVLVDSFIAADPVARLDALYSDLDDAGMLRQGDEARYEQMRSGIQSRIAELPAELEYWRDNPNGNYGYCSYPYVQCGYSCQLPQDCYLCGQEPVPVPEPMPGGPLWLLAGDGGVFADAGGAASYGIETSVAADAGALAVTNTDTTLAVSGAASAVPDASGPLTSGVGTWTNEAGLPPSEAGAPVLDAGATTGEPVGVDSTAAGDTTTSGGQSSAVTSEGETTDGYTCQPYINYYYAR